MHRDLLYDSPNLRVLSFNFEPGQELPVHSHDADSEVTLIILEGEGEFTGAHPMPARAGQLQIMPVSEPHGLRAKNPAAPAGVHHDHFITLSKALIASRQATLELKRDGQISGA